MNRQVEATGAEILVESLVAEGVDTVFGLPGLQLDYIFDAIYDRRSAIRVIHTRHEQATALAFGYGQASGRVDTCLVVPGAGVLNTTLSTAYACNAPVLFWHVRRIQKEMFGGRLIASDLYNPNFSKFAMKVRSRSRPHCRKRYS